MTYLLKRGSSAAKRRFEGGVARAAIAVSSRSLVFDAVNEVSMRWTEAWMSSRSKVYEGCSVFPRCCSTVAMGSLT